MGVVSWSSSNGTYKPSDTAQDRDLLPNKTTNGVSRLGEASATGRWSGLFVRTINLDGYIEGNLIPNDDYTLGNTDHRWDAFLNNLDLNSLDLGSGFVESNLTPRPQAFRLVHQAKNGQTYTR
ncbi:MAG: hypothetical protein HRF49_08630 [bacterium]|jgi:hypothetical protein